MRQLHVIHHGLRDLRSHFFGEGLGWVAACRQRGVPLRLYVHKTAGPDILRELPARAAFRHRAGTASIARLRGEGVSDHAMMARFFAEDCAALEAEGLDGEDVVVVTFASEIEVMGAAEWLERLAPGQRPRVIFVFHIPPSLSVLIREDRTGVAADFSEFIAGMTRLKRPLPPQRIGLFATTPHLAALMRSVAQHPCAEAPHPTLYLSDELLAAKPEPPAHVCVPGELREEKGGKLVSDILLRFAEARPGKLLTVQANDETDGGALAERLASCNSPYSVYYGRMGHAQYQRHLVASDILLLPYDWRRYALRASGVFSEAAGFGIVTVVPDRTWMADSLRAGFGGGTIFAEQTVDSILEALIEASDNHAALRERARRTMQDWRRRHSVAALLETILRFASTS
ncbi:MAG TPA: hypothetical protein VMU06_06070 [Stellaceae bacterium]|nr:hypothetical protein [Stellaceae bacterium]